jgi:hypothetical protein
MSSIFSLICQEKRASYDVHAQDVFGAGSAQGNREPLLPPGSVRTTAAGVAAYHYSKRLMRAMGANTHGTSVGTVAPYAAGAYAAYKTKRLLDNRRARREQRGRAE